MVDINIALAPRSICALNITVKLIGLCILVLVIIAQFAIVQDVICPCPPNSNN